MRLTGYRAGLKGIRPRRAPVQLPWLTSFASAGAFLVTLCVMPTPLHAQAVPVTGRVLDGSTSQPVVGATVRFLPGSTIARSDSIGRFAAELQPGPYDLVVEHVAYGSQTHAWMVSNADQEIEIRIDPEAIRLTEVRAKVPMTEEERDARAEGAAVRRISREELDEAAMRGRRLADILRTHTVGLRIREGVYYTKDSPAPTRILCIEAGTRGNVKLAPSASGGGARPMTRGSNTGRPCDMVPVFRDGIQLLDPGALLLHYDPDDLDRIEWLSAIAASARFGTLAENKGVLLLHTRTGRR